MKLRKGFMVSFEQVILALVLLAVLAENQFCRIVAIDTGLLKMLLLGVVGVSALLVIMTTLLRNMKGSTGFQVLYLACLFLFLLMQFCYTILKYDDQSVSIFFQLSQGYLWILLMIPIIYLFSRKTGMYQLMEMVKWAVVISLLLHIIHAVIYNMTGRELLDMEFYKKILIRNDRLRLWDLSSLEAMAALWCFYQLMTKHGSVAKNAVHFAVIMGALFYVEQTRMMQVGLLVSMAVMYIQKKAHNNFGRIVKVFVVAAVFLYVVMSGVMEEFSASFSTTGEYASSTLIRQDELEHAFQLIAQHPINGVGLLTPETLDRYITYYGRGKFGLTDIGIVGSFAQIGLWTVVIFLWPMCRALQVTVRAYKAKHEMFVFLLGLFVFLVISSGTLFVLNTTRIFMWPWCIAIYEYCGYCLKRRITIR